MLVYTMDETNYEWYYTYVNFSSALPEYTSQQFGDDINKKFSMFLTIEYSTNGEKTTLLDPSQIPGSVISFSGIVTNSEALPIQGTITIVPNEQPQCIAQQYNAFKNQFNTLMNQLDDAINEDAISLKYAVDVAFFLPAWTNCSAQLDSILDAKLIQTNITTTDCVDPTSDDSCCSLKAAWSSVCRPREVTTLAELYTVDSSNLGSCGSLTCTESFLKDYIDSSLQPCEELSAAVAAYTMDKRILF
jgi:hypothetical protein